jgi:site-specific DNA recombinase
MKRAIGYVRVSTEQQASEGVSIEAQQAKIQAYCELYGFDLTAIEVDAGASASTLSREGLQRALDALEAGDADALVVVKLDRLTRSVRDLDALLTHYFAERFALVSVAEQVDTTTATGRMILNVLMSVSQWEREVIGERTKAAMQHKKSLGEYTGGKVPFGKCIGADGVTLEAEPTEQAIIDDIKALQHSGLSLAQIADELNHRGAMRRNGNQWHKVAVSRVIKGAA